MDEIFRRKEETPDSVSLIDMQSQIISRFGNGFLAPKAVYEAYCQFIDDILGAPDRPPVALRGLYQ